MVLLCAVALPLWERALCYAFGDQWTGLNMTTEEFEGIWKKYERKDVSHSYAQSLDTSGSKGAGYQGGGAYGQGQGQPESLILWQPFAQDMHRYVYGDNRREEEKALVEAEIALMAQSEAAEEAALGAHDADDNLGDAKARLAARNAKRAAEAAKAVENLPPIECPHAVRCRRGLVELARMAVDRIK